MFSCHNIIAYENMKYRYCVAVVTPVVTLIFHLSFYVASCSHFLHNQMGPVVTCKFCLSREQQRYQSRYLFVVILPLSRVELQSNFINSKMSERGVKTNKLTYVSRC